MNGKISSRPRHQAQIVGLLALLVIVAIAACTELMSIEDEQLAEELVLEPAEAVLGIGRTLQLQATFLNAQGEPVPGTVDSWTSSDSAIATVNDGGLVTAISVGTAEITATAKKGKGHGRDNAPGQLKKNSKIIVPPDTVASVDVIPSSLNLVVGGTLQLEAVVRDAEGNVLEGRFVTWSSSDSEVAAVDGDGAVTASAPGTAVITATSEGKQGTAAVVVIGVQQVAIWPASVTIEPGVRVQFYAAILWSDGEAVCDTTGAARDTSVLFNLTEYPAACDSAIARLDR
jgi:hypothetical protein